jgi:GTP cyclohydrolase II
MPEPARRVVRVATTRLPTRHALFAAHAYEDRAAGVEHVALVLGDLNDPADGPPLVRLHSECLTGDALGSRRCDCGEQLDAALAAVAAEGRGAVVYVRGQEGRGIGLGGKLRAYALQDGGLDTLDANLALGLPADAREYGGAAAVLADLGVHAVHLLSSNPAKAAALEHHGVAVARRTPLAVEPRPEDARYLRTKAERMGHDPVAADGGWSELLAGRVPRGSDLGERYGPLVGAGPRLVLAQLGQSLDGFIAARTGDAVFVTGEADRTHLHRLRALVDAVVVGVGTVVADDPRLTVRAVPGRHPVRVVLDPAGRLPRDARVLTDAAAPTLWVVAADRVPPDLAPAPAGSRPPVRAGSAVPPPLTTGNGHRPGGPATAPGGVEVVPLPRSPEHGDGFAPAAVLAALARRGLGRVLVEGGGVTVSRFLAAGAIDRLLLTTAPLLVGDGVPGVRFYGADRLADAVRAPSRRFLLGDDTCVELDLAAARGGSSPASTSTPGSTDAAASRP